LPENGLGSWTLHHRDAELAHRLGQSAHRMSIEWSRIFPDGRAADESAVDHYREVLMELRRRGMQTFVTLNHFTLPLWLHDPIAARDAFAGRDPNDPPPADFGPAGWLDPRIATEFGKYAGFLARELNDLVDCWTPINEPLVVAIGGYVSLPDGHQFPPGAISFPAVLAAVENMVAANAAAYDAIKAHDPGARVGLVQNMIAFTAADPDREADRRGAEHADQLFNRMFCDAAAGKADFIGVNYYFRGRVTGLDAPVARDVPLLDFVAATAYRTDQAPHMPECPGECSDFGSEIHPEGLRAVLETAASYGLPLYVTENGIADADDTRRARFLRDHLAVLGQAIADGIDVRGYFHWSLVDNFEWAHGFAPKFGLHSFDPGSLERRERPSAALYRQVCRANALPQ
jgi:beta-glucosidase/6-phospho-beta-glucosidase/beta-galactosidase